MSDARRTHELDQRTAAAEDFATEVSAFYRRLRAAKVPPVAAQGITETWVQARMGEEREERW